MNSSIPSRFPNDPLSGRSSVCDFNLQLSPHFSVGLRCICLEHSLPYFANAKNEADVKKPVARKHDTGFIFPVLKTAINYLFLMLDASATDKLHSLLIMACSGVPLVTGIHLPMTLSMLTPWSFQVLKPVAFTN